MNFLGKTDSNSKDVEAVIWPIEKVLICLIGSCLVTAVTFFSIYFLVQKGKKSRMQDLGYRISAIIQTGPEKEALPTVYLAELLDLSLDRPRNLYAFDVKLGESKLLQSPLICQAQIKRIPPNALYIDYAVRKPIAKLADYENIAVDKDGYLFPLAPFFSPKELPEIYLGLPMFGEMEDSLGRSGGLWQTPMNNRFLTLSFELIDFLDQIFKKEEIRVKKIDVSNAFAPSLGLREIVLFTEEKITFDQNGKMVSCHFPKILRVATKDYVLQLNNFLSLRRNMMEAYLKQLKSSKENLEGSFVTKIVDLRIPHLAFVEQ